VTGQIWDARIREEIDSCHIALVLVSQAFLNSKYCRNNEVAAFLKLRRDVGLRIFPIILSSCEWDQELWLTGTQFLPVDGKNIELNFREKGKRLNLYLRIVKDLRKLVHEIRNDRDPSGGVSQ
jgi:hypothetical protein